MSIRTRTPPNRAISSSLLASLRLTRAPMSPSVLALAVCHSTSGVPGFCVGISSCVNVSAIRASTC